MARDAVAAPEDRLSGLGDEFRPLEEKYHGSALGTDFALVSMQSERNWTMTTTTSLTRTDLDHLASLDWGDRGETARVLFTLLPRLDTLSAAATPQMLAESIGIPAQKVIQSLRSLMKRGVLEVDDSDRFGLVAVTLSATY